MNSAILLIPLFLIRYGLLALINKTALPKAAHFPPMQGIEKTMYWIYQASTALIILYMFFLEVRTSAISFQIGLSVYLLGILLFALAIVSFANPGVGALKQRGLYRFSRNPMYSAYFIYFLGCVILTQSMMLFFFLCIFQISAHWIILSEEKWCAEKYGKEYTQYMQKVRRYIGIY